MEPREKRKGLLVFLGCDVEGRFKGDVGRGIFDGDEGGATLDETPVPVDVDAVELSVVVAPPNVDSFPLTNISSDACLNLLELGGSFDSEVDRWAVNGSFEFEVAAPVGFGGRGLKVIIVDSGGIATTSDEGPARVVVVATGTDKRR